jgi:hypothetical protein
MSVDKALAPVIGCRPQSTGVVRINATLGPVVTRSIARSASTNVAVDLYRVPAELNREAYLPHLATSMNNLANRLAEAGRYERALILAREAAAVPRCIKWVW